jgi:glyoxylase-like metal-dependent hydrolase (beta-lactamase superfamily II)
LHSADERLLKSANLYVKLFDGSCLIKIPSVDYFYDQSNVQDVIKRFSIEVIFTPGHTQGSVCLLIDGCLFTGDTLLNEKIGRTDLPGGNEQVLKESLKIISKMPSHINIYPGHGSSSTIGYELKNNSCFIQALQ